MGIRILIERASWTLVDQGVVSFGNFALNVLLARTLGEEEYGEFALFLGSIFILRTIDYSLLSYPLSLRLAGAGEEERAKLLGNTVLLTVILAMVLAVVMAFGTLLLEVDNIVLPACVCFLCWQAQETSRRFLLAEFKYRSAVAGDGVAYVGQAVLIGLVAWPDGVTLSAALYMMSATFALGAIVHASKLEFAWPSVSEALPLAREYCSIGKWSVINYQLVLARVQLFPWMLAGLAGTAATASLQAGLNIANMMNPIIFGIGNAIPQVAAHAYRTGGTIGAARAALGYVLFGLIPILFIAAAGLLMPAWLLKTVYGPSSPYLAIAAGLQLLVIAGVFDYVAEMISKTLLGVEAGKLASLVNVAAVGTAAVLAFVLIGPLGVFGACLALLISNFVRAIGAMMAIAWLIARERVRSPARSTSAADAVPIEKALSASAER